MYKFVGHSFTYIIYTIFVYLSRKYHEELPHAVRKCQSKRENHSENRAQHRNGWKGEIQLNHEKYEKHVREEYTAQKSEHALQNEIFERAIRAKEPQFFINPRIFHGRNYSAPKMFDPSSASTEIMMNEVIERKKKKNL